MGTMSLTTVAAMSFGIGIANAQPLSQSAIPRQQISYQYNNWLAGGG
jgi:hypothetical protein